MNRKKKDGSVPTNFGAQAPTGFSAFGTTTAMPSPFGNPAAQSTSLFGGTPGFGVPQQQTSAFGQVRTWAIACSNRFCSCFAMRVLSRGQLSLFFAYTLPAPGFLRCSDLLRHVVPSLHRSRALMAFPHFKKNIWCLLFSLFCFFGNVA